MIKKAYYDPEAEGDYPVCPHCGEIAYNDNECVFCGGKYEIETPPGTRTIKIVRDGYTITQGRDHHVMVCNERGEMVMHARCLRAFTVQELEELWDGVKRAREAKA